MWCGGMTLAWGSKILMSGIYPNPYERWCVQYTQWSILLYEKLSPLSVPESRSPAHVPVSRNICFRLVLGFAGRWENSNDRKLPSCRYQHDAFIEHNRSMNSSGWGLQTFNVLVQTANAEGVFFFVTLPDVDLYSASNRRCW